MAKTQGVGTYVFKEQCYPDVKSAIDKNKGQELMNSIRKFVDTNHNQLNDHYFEKISWREDGPDGQAIFNTIGKRPDEISKLIKESGQTDAHWILYNKPSYWSMVCIIKYFQDTKKEKELHMSILYLSIILYSSVVNARIMYPFNKAILDYIIQTMSNRYDIKKYGTILAVLDKLSMGCHATYKDWLNDDDFCDLHILNYISNMYVRINNFVKEILTIYNKYKDKKVYMNSEKESNDEENFYETSNISSKIIQMGEKVSNTIIMSNLNDSIVEMSAKIAGVSIAETKNVVKKIIEKDDKLIKEFIILFLQQYLVVDKHPEATFASNNFLVYANKIYSKSNTNDKGVIRIKEILDGWLKQYSEKYLKTNRVASIIAWRKSIYLFFCISTQQVILNRY